MYPTTVACANTVPHFCPYARVSKNRFKSQQEMVVVKLSNVAMLPWGVAHNNTKPKRQFVEKIVS